MPKDKVIKYIAYLTGAIILLCLSFFRVFESYELQTLDLRFKLRPPIAVNPDIVIVEIAEDSIKELGRWPLSRRHHANLVDYLRQLGVRAIVFDILFGEKSADDEALIEATSKAKGLVYYPIVVKPEETKTDRPLRSSEIEVPLIEGLEKTAKGVGFINVIADSDGKIRRTPLKLDCRGREYEQLAYMAARDYLGDKFPLLPKGSEAEFIINYPGKWNNSFKRYSFVDLLASFEETVEGEESRINLSDFYNKVCFVGVTETGGHDLKANPIEPAYPMVGAQASIFNSIIQSKFVVRANKVINLIILLLVCSIIVFAVSVEKPLLGLGISLALVISFIVAGFALFIFAGLWIDIFCPTVLSAGVYLATTLNRYIKHKRNSLLMERELSVAKKIQMDFLPSSVPQLEVLDMTSSIETAKAVGGDLFDFVDFDTAETGKVGIMIGDVSGKGVPAALFMARSIADFRHFTRIFRSPSSVLKELNNQIALNYKAGLFITMFYIIYDANTNGITFSNAGHLPALWVKADGAIELLKTEGMPLGLIEGQAYSEETVNLKSGDFVVLYTDGVTEARNTDGEEFGEERLRETALAQRRGTSSDILNSIKAHLKKFVRTVPQYDDCTVIVFKVK